MLECFCSGRPSEVDDDKLKAIIESIMLLTVREVAKQVNVSHKTIENPIKRQGLVKNLDISVHRTHIHRVNICDTHFKRNAFDPYRKKISLAMKNRSFIIRSIEKIHGPGMVNQHKPCQKLQ